MTYPGLPTFCCRRRNELSGFGGVVKIVSDLSFLSFVLFPLLVNRFQSMLHLFFLNSLSLIALIDQAEMTIEPFRRKCNETRWA